MAVPTRHEISKNLFLDERRIDSPELVAMLCDGHKTESTAQQFENYSERGEKEEYEYIGPENLTSIELVGEMVEAHPSRPISVLDIGAGACAQLIKLHEIYGNNVTTVGLTAHTLEDLPGDALNHAKLQGVDVRIGNADFWSTVVKPHERFDVILSRYGARWLGDPLAATERALSQMYEGGIFWAYPIRFPIDTPQRNCIDEALVSTGYEVESIFDDGLNLNVNFFVNKQTNSNGPIFTNIGYEDFTLNIGNYLSKNGDRRQQAYYKQLV